MLIKNTQEVIQLEAAYFIPSTVMTREIVEECSKIVKGESFDTEPLKRMMEGCPELSSKLISLGAAFPYTKITVTLSLSGAITGILSSKYKGKPEFEEKLKELFQKYSASSFELSEEEALEAISILEDDQEWSLASILVTLNDKPMLLNSDALTHFKKTIESLEKVLEESAKSGKSWYMLGVGEEPQLI